MNNKNVKVGRGGGRGGGCGSSAACLSPRMFERCDKLNIKVKIYEESQLMLLAFAESENVPK